MVKKFKKNKQFPLVSSKQKKGRIIEKLKNWLPWIIIGFVILIFFSDFIFQGKVFLPLDYLQFWPPWNAMPEFKMPINNIVISDVVDNLYPLLSFISSCLKDGNIPLWNPLTFLGLPTAMIGNVNIAFNPLYLMLLWLFNPEVAHTLSILINICLILTFSYLFFVQIGLTKYAALWGSMVFAFNGHLMVWLEFGAADFVFACVAISLYLFERSLKGEKVLFIISNGLVLGILLLSGSIQWTFFMFPLVGLYAVARTMVLWRIKSSILERLNPLRCFLGSFLIAVLIGLPNIWFFSEYMHESHRNAMSFEWMLEHPATFYPELLGTFLFPNLFGYQPHGVYFARDSLKVVYQNYNELTVYFGIAAFILMLFSLRVKEYKQMAIFWLCILMGAFAVAMRLPLIYDFFYKYAPGFKAIQATRVIILLQPAFAYLVALGVHGLESNPMSSKQLKIVSWGIIGLLISLIACLIGVHSYFVNHPYSVKGYPLEQHFQMQNPNFLQPLLILFVVWLFFFLYQKRKISAPFLCLLLLILNIMDLLSFGLKVNTRCDRSMVFPKTSGIEYLLRDKDVYRILPLGFHYNTWMCFNIATFGGYASSYPMSYSTLISSIEGKENPERKAGWAHQNYVEPVAYQSRLLPLFNIKYIITPQKLSLPSGNYKLIYSSDINIYQVKDFLPRVFAVFNSIKILDLNQAVEMMQEETFDFRNTALVEKDLTFESGPLSVEETPFLKLTIRDSDHIMIDADMKRRGLIVISQQYFPGWEAKIDGVSAEVLRVNAVLMGVIVQSGKHAIELQYCPKSIKLGCYVTFSTILLCLIVLFLRFLGFVSKKKAEK